MEIVTSTQYNIITINKNKVFAGIIRYQIVHPYLKLCHKIQPTHLWKVHYIEASQTLIGILFNLNGKWECSFCKPYITSLISGILWLKILILIFSISTIFTRKRDCIRYPTTEREQGNHSPSPPSPYQGLVTRVFERTQKQLCDNAKRKWISATVLYERGPRGRAQRRSQRMHCLTIVWVQ